MVTAMVVSGLLVEVRAEPRIGWSEGEMRAVKHALKKLRGGSKGGHIVLYLSERAFEEARDKMRVMPDTWLSGG
jgi:hypothetical protein